MKKFAMAFLAATMAFGMAACSSAEEEVKTDAEKVEDTVKNDAEDAANDVKDEAEKVEGETEKTGSVTTDDGATVEATIVEKDGKIKSISIDEIEPDGNSKKEKADYMKNASPIGKEWNEQVEFLEQYIMENGVDAVKMDEKGYPTNEDLLAGCSINVKNFVDAVKAAEAN